ncbi:MAG TPA: hypothetical protein VHM72_07835 [Solirubrobacteraceae bacterium]|nr:hypothetical protein [Solirubrobacteraceae bacterium]
MSRYLPLMDGGVTGRRWPWFVAWAAVGACIGLSLSALALVTLPLAVILTVAFRRRSRRRELLGVVAGVGIAVALFGSLHANYQACSSTRFLGHAGAVYSCGGVDGPRWLIVGIAAAIAALVGYWYMAHRAGGSTMAHATPIHD